MLSNQKIADLIAAFAIGLNDANSDKRRVLEVKDHDDILYVAYQAAHELICRLSLGE